MSFNSNKIFGRINVRKTASIHAIDLDKLAVTQATAITSGVTLHSPAGHITTVSTTLATQGSATFTVTNSVVVPDSLILGNINHYAGNGIPVVYFRDVTRGSFKVCVTNAHTTAPLSATIKLGFTVL
jgi:hypothetical protein